MTREKAIEVVKSATVYTPKEMEALETLIPELLESEDERIRKGLIDIFNSALGQDFLQRKAGLDRDKVIAYLEKQKEQKSKIDACGFPLRDEGESACSYLERCLSPDMRNIWYEACSEIKEKQKEQKPNYCHHEVDETGWTEEYRKAYYDGWNNCNMQHSQLKAVQKPAEWSEEDKVILNAAIEMVDNSDTIFCFEVNKYKVKNWLKSLRPCQPCDVDDNDKEREERMVENYAEGRES